MWLEWGKAIEIAEEGLRGAMLLGCSWSIVYSLSELLNMF